MTFPTNECGAATLSEYRPTRERGHPKGHVNEPSGVRCVALARKEGLGGQRHDSLIRFGAVLRGGAQVIVQGERINFNRIVPRGFRLKD